MNLTKEACKAYRQALSHNPFLWTAYEALCQLERGTTNSVSATDIFKMTTVPNFLQQHINNSQPQEQYQKMVSSSPSVIVKQSVVTATPNNSSCTGTGYATPDLFAVPSVSLGSAIASSTPTLLNLSTNLQFGNERMKHMTPGQFSPKALTFTPTANQPTTDYSITQAPCKVKHVSAR